MKYYGLSLWLSFFLTAPTASASRSKPEKPIDGCAQLLETRLFPSRPRTTKEATDDFWARAKKRAEFSVGQLAAMQKRKDRFTVTSQAVKTETLPQAFRFAIKDLYEKGNEHLSAAFVYTVFDRNSEEIKKIRDIKVVPISASAVDGTLLPTRERNFLFEASDETNFLMHEFGRKFNQIVPESDDDGLVRVVLLKRSSASLIVQRSWAALLYDRMVEEQSRARPLIIDLVTLPLVATGEVQHTRHSYQHPQERMFSFDVQIVLKGLN